MRKLLIYTVLLTFLPYLAGAQSKKQIDGFLGIQFGSDSAAVKAMLLSKGGVFDAQSSKPGRLCFKGLHINDQAAGPLFVSFTDNKAYAFIFSYENYPKESIIKSYNELIGDICSVYGKCTRTTNFQKPFYEGDGRELEAIPLGKATYISYWTAKNKNQLAIAIEKDFRISIMYRDSKLMQTTMAKDKSDL